MALSNAGVVQQLTRDQPREMMTAVAQSRGECLRAMGRKRLTAVERVEAFIEERAYDAVTVGDICRAAGVSERTLEYVFVEPFGVGRLANHESGGRCFNAWGFWHMNNLWPTTSEV